ncbi:hypothetical protein CI109_104544 [Kwoniella shandongensis]|uniref:Uncharacterized protein n=1 Tax=Kwoniella shandongensis TaxID=1734106 RepID=A0A5M6BVX8_9TREE|nr:uncharacterized protein CI109_005566 [Kwoniella shandongensis]KAA5526132.1 hypothetical protein CI109_005566 [Kwoniella shandongensis]
MTSTPQPIPSPSAVSHVPPRPTSAPPTGTVSGSGTITPSRAIPTDFKSSLAAWWSNSSYKEARLAEERLLRKLAFYESTPHTPPEVSKGWFGLGTPSANASASGSNTPTPTSDPALTDSQSIPLNGTGLVATLRNVFIPTPDPAQAPEHPADPRTIVDGGATDSAASSASDLSSRSGTSSEKKHKHRLSKCKKDEGKLVDYINTLEISTRENKDSKEAVVVLHGYAAALGFFFRNWESISQSAASTSRRTFFLDWLGMGLSSRPSPALLNSPSSAPTPTRVSRAEHFFVSSLESWRIASGLEKMILVGHSLGGYLASAYAVRYPERVSGLILVSPAGIPHGPEYVKYPLTAELGGKPRPKQLSRENSETSRDLDGAVDAAEAEIEGGGKASEAKGEAKEWQERRKQSLVRQGMMKFFVWGWERGLSPFSILRSVGPFGPMWVGKYSARRFAAQSEEDVRDLHSYIYGTSIMKGSGEYCISHILAPGAYARIPILDRINRVKVPVTFLYGDNDWMDVDGGHASVEALKKAGNQKASVHVIPKAGHHLYLDNPEVTNKILDQAIKAIPTDRT